MIDLNLFLFILDHDFPFCSFFFVIQCIGTVPCCNRCKKWHLDCDLNKNVFYNYSTVQSLLNNIKELESRLGASQSLLLNNSNNTMISIDDFTHEVGSLTNSNNDDTQGKYIGAATGSNFAKVFLKQMHLQKLDDLNYLSSNDFSSNDLNSSFYSSSCASLPPYSLAKLAIDKYINSIHIYYPALIIKDLLNSLDLIYNSPKDLTYHEKYIIFIVIAIGLERGEKDSNFINYYNQFKPIEFFNTAFKYLEKLLINRSIFSLQELLLLLIWLIHKNVFQDDIGDLWHLGRYLMTLAIELNLSDPNENESENKNKNKNLTDSKKELNNRLFWTTYILERSNAVKFGRGLSLRRQDIKTDLPKLTPDDYLFNNTKNKNLLLGDYNQVKFNPCLISIELYEIYGVLLETVYISRTTGSKPILSIETIIDYKNRIQESVNKLLIQLNNDIPDNLACYHELRIKSCIASIILNRPSPSFPSPDFDSLIRCKQDCLQSIESFKYLTTLNWKTSPNCLHELVNIGLTMIFCCWKTEKDSELLKTFSTETVEIMNEMIKFYPNFVKFKNLYIVVSSIIIHGFDKNLQFKRVNSNASSVSADMLFADVPSPLQQLKQNLQHQNQPQSQSQSQPESQSQSQSQSLGSIPIRNNQNQYQHQHGYQNQYTQQLSRNSSDVSHQHFDQNDSIQRINRANNIDQGISPLTQGPDYVQTRIHTQTKNGDQIQNQSNDQQSIFSNNQNQTSHSSYPMQHNLPQNYTYQNGNVMDSLTQELFQDVFKQYYFQGNQTVREDIDQLFEFQKFNWA